MSEPNKLMEFNCDICKKVLEYKREGDTFYFGNYGNTKPCVCIDCHNIYIQDRMRLYDTKKFANQLEFVVTKSLKDGKVL